MSCSCSFCKCLPLLLILLVCFNIVLKTYVTVSFGQLMQRFHLLWIFSIATVRVTRHYSIWISVPFEEVLDEVAGYFSESFGNSTRIDYGTGHELAFIAFLACLFKCGVLHAPNPSDSTVPNDYIGIGLVIAPQYLDLVRRLQIYYRMEPAGSHGVWCLDDFQFVPFIWGSSQLIGKYGLFMSMECVVGAALLIILKRWGDREPRFWNF